ncbi:MAG: hypothetical protein ACKOA8_13125 [Deltaproteobacteria bacterium]
MRLALVILVLFNSAFGKIIACCKTTEAQINTVSAQEHPSCCHKKTSQEKATKKEKTQKPHHANQDCSHSCCIPFYLASQENTFNSSIDSKKVALPKFQEPSNIFLAVRKRPPKLL